jgi:hypothetical protein
MKVMTLQAAGNETAARREEIDNQFRSEEIAAGNDDQQLGIVQNLHKQALKNFDDDANRQSRFQQAQSEDKLSGYREEANEAKLEAEGKPDEAKIDRLRFSVQQRSKSLQEQADATADPVRKAQLQKEANEATVAGNSEIDSLKKQLQRESQTGGQNLNTPGNTRDFVPALADAAKKLDDAATKLDKAISGAKSVSLLKD